MSVELAVYSADRVRAKIIERTLARRRRRAVVFETFLSAKKAFLENPPDLLVYEALRASPQEWKFFRNYAATHPQTDVLFLVGSARKAELAAAGWGGKTCLAEELDPELIQALVEERAQSVELAKAPPLQKTLLESRRKMKKTARKAVRRIPLAVALLLGAGVGFVLWSTTGLPRVEQLGEYAPLEASKVTSQDNVPLAEYYLERRTFIPSERIPARVKAAFVAAEDKNFYRHFGVDPARLFRATVENVKQGSFVQGGSTITQQLAKMLFLKPEKSIRRKIQEIALALRIERRYTKDEILGLYLNQAYFGTRAYGIEAAAQTYFGKTTAELTLAEGAVLAALPKAPSVYSPFRNPDRCRERRDYVLSRMLKNGTVTKREYDEAAATAVPEVFHAPVRKAPYFLDHLRSELEDRFGSRLQTAGLEVITTLDYRVQEEAERAVAEGVEALRARGLEGLQAALVALDLADGRILAMVGGTDYAESQFNRATQALRQSGSVFKPFVFLAALENGFQPQDAIIYERPRSASGEEEGLEEGGNGGPNGGETETVRIPLRVALAQSLNGPTVILARRVGLRTVFAAARRAGVRSEIRPFVSSVLGASEATLLELVSAYATLATSYAQDPVSVDRVIDRARPGIWRPQVRRESVIDQKALSGIRSFLRAAVLEGTAAPAGFLGRPVYGKTGTTNDAADAWFIGFDDRVVAGVWVGRDDGTAIAPEETGTTAALPIWVAFMKSLERM
ncbi:MAG: PBP1A family penicillin-binding protein [Candidatus Aminicenantes bacterium]|nr:PBP1A family penicillin-binding protein [Candidatus Aminicenantes bacterium]